LFILLAFLNAVRASHAGFLSTFGREDDNSSVVSSTSTASSVGDDKKGDVVIIPGELPCLDVPWSDGNRQRVSHLRLLLSGLEVGDEDNKIEGRVGKSSKESIVMMDISDSVIFRPELYFGKYMRDQDGDEIYDRNDAKVVAMKAAIEDLMGKSVNCTMKFSVKSSSGGIKVEDKLIPQWCKTSSADGKTTKNKKKAVKLFHVGKKDNKQAMVHLEMQGEDSGFWSAEQKHSYYDFTRNPDAGSAGFFSVSDHGDGDGGDNMSS
jgi:hypothetical protein